MNRLTETSFEKEMRIGFSKIDRIFDDAISKLDAMKAEYEKNLAPKSNKLIKDIFSAYAMMQNQGQLQSIFMGERSYAALQQMPMSFDRGSNDMSVATRFAMMGGVGFAPVYRSSFICSGIA